MWESDDSNTSLIDSVQKHLENISLCTMKALKVKQYVI